MIYEAAAEIFDSNVEQKLIRCLADCWVSDPTANFNLELLYDALVPKDKRGRPDPDVQVEVDKATEKLAKHGLIEATDVTNTRWVVTEELVETRFAIREEQRNHYGRALDWCHRHKIPAWMLVLGPILALAISLISLAVSLWVLASS